MENNFTMETYEQDKKLHIDLKGTFDGASAFALIQKIGEEICDKNNSVHVETKDISKVYSFGRSILSSNIPKAQRKSLYFSGAMADQIAPDGCAVKKCSGDCKNCKCKKLSMQNR